MNGYPDLAREHMEKSISLLDQFNLLHINDSIPQIANYAMFLTEQQELLMKTCEEAGVYNNEILDSETSKALQKLEEAGVTVYTVDNPDEWLAASQSFYDAAEEKYGWSDGLVDTVKNIIGQ